jgi:cytochrome c1
MPDKRFAIPLILLLLLLVLAACARPLGRVEKSASGGDVEQGRAAIVYYGCGSCHTIPGVPGAVALVGPPLNQFEQRHYIAGALTNTAENLAYWIQFPQRVEPGTAMPDLNVTEADARNIVAYLYNQ